MSNFTPTNPKGARDRGATMVEYGLMVALVALMAFSAVQMLGHRTESTFNTAAEALDAGNAGGGDGSVTTAPSDGGSSGGGSGGSGNNQGAPTTTTAPSDSGGLGQQGGGSSTATTMPTTTTTAPASTTTTKPKAEPGSTATIADASSSFYWFNADKQGGEGAWKASVTFTNDYVRHQYLTLEVTQVDDKGKPTTFTVKDFYVPANGKATFDQWDNSYSMTNGKEKGTVSVSVKVVSIKTADLNWQTVSYQTPDSTPSTVKAPKIP